MPTSSRGWLPKGENFYVCTETGRQDTTAVACMLVCAKLYGQVILQGTTDAVVLCMPLLDKIKVDDTKSHWSSTDTLMAMLSWCDACMMNPDGGVLSWVCLLDVASTHISKEFRSRVSLCGQPLDLAFMKAFKSSLARQAAEHVAWMILGAPEPTLLKLELGQIQWLLW